MIYFCLQNFNIKKRSHNLKKKQPINQGLCVNSSFHQSRRTLLATQLPSLIVIDDLEAIAEKFPHQIHFLWSNPFFKEHIVCKMLSLFWYNLSGNAVVFKGLSKASLVIYLSSWQRKQSRINRKKCVLWFNAKLCAVYSVVLNSVENQWRERKSMSLFFIRKYLWKMITTFSIKLSDKKIRTCSILEEVGVAWRDGKEHL